MSQKFRAVLFDMDGVLLDSYEAWYQLMNAAARDFGYPPITREQFRDVWGQGPDLDVELFFTRHTVAQVEDYYNRHFREYTPYVRTNPHARSVFTTLKERHIGIAVITNTPSSIAREVLGYAKLDPDVIVGGTDVPRGKPAPDMVFKALELLGLSPQEAVFVGDSHFDRDAAAGARVRYLEYDIQADSEEINLLAIIRSLG